MKTEQMIRQLLSYRNGVHGAFFESVAERIKELKENHFHLSAIAHQNKLDAEQAEAKLASAEKVIDKVHWRIGEECRDDCTDESPCANCLIKQHKEQP